MAKIYLSSLLNDFRKAIIIPIATLIVIFAGTALAATYSNSFKLFLQDKYNLLTKHSQSIDLSCSDKGITMTVETAIDDNVFAYTMLKLTKTDGSAMNAQVHIKLNGQPQTCQTIPSEDKKTLYYIIYSESYTDTTKTNEISTDCFIENEKRVDIQSSISLSELYNKQPLEIITKQNDENKFIH